MSVLTAPVNDDLIRTGPGVLLASPYGTALPATLAAAVTLHTTPGAWRHVGATVDGSELTYSATSDGVTVAERLKPVKQVITGVAMSYTFTMSELSPMNLALATNADPQTAIITGTADTTFVWPKSGGVARVSLLWLADDALEALVIAKAFASGDITIPRRKGVDQASVGVTFTVEDNGDATVGSGRDAYNLFDKALLGA